MEADKTEAPANHDAVLPGGTCAKCGWKWGDPNPHEVHFGALRNEPTLAAPAPKPVAKAPDPNACDAVALTQTCPKCGWSYEEEMKGLTPRPHPITLA